MSDPAVKLYSSPSPNPAPRLSVLIPFYKDDPRTLLKELSDISPQSVEILIYDDGTGDTALTQSLSKQIQATNNSIKLLSAQKNKGRSFGRNALFNAAKADWVLFLDADMRPMSTNFLNKYLEIITQNKADIIFGGFKVLSERGPSETEIHRVMSLTSDCEDAAARQALGPKNVASSNLCIRKKVLIKAPFDDRFTGWGWEDSEWAARASKTFKLVHIDNPALHLGLETTDTLLRRFKTSGHNYARFTKKHPEIAKSLPLYRWIIRLKKWPLHKLLRPILKFIIKLPFMPINLRINTLKLWRASWYSESLS